MYVSDEFYAIGAPGFAWLSGEGNLVLGTAIWPLRLKIGLSATGNLEVPGSKDVRLLVVDSLDREALVFEGGPPAVLSLGSNSTQGKIIVKDKNGSNVCVLDGKERQIKVGPVAGNNAATWIAQSFVTLSDKNTKQRVILDGVNELGYTNPCPLVVRSNPATGEGSSTPQHDVLRFYADVYDRASLRIGCRGGGKAGDIHVLDEQGNTKVEIDGKEGDVLLFNADYAEEFPVAQEQVLLPGEVVSTVGGDSIVRTTKAYDGRVVGIVSGAGGLKPGIVLDRREHEAGRAPIAIGGKVYCKADASQKPIEVGDLLVSCEVAGHAMKADDPVKAFGCVIGKALHPLSNGQGEILVLAGLG